MADKKKLQVVEPVIETEEAPTGKKRWLLRIGLGLVVGVIILVVATLAGIYFKFIDVSDFAQRNNLSDYPVVGKLFSRPATNFETVDGDGYSTTSGQLADNQNAGMPKIDTGAMPAVQPTALPQPAAQPTMQLTNAEEMAKIMEQAKKDEQKRISKTARLLGTMKADEAAQIINQLDDQTVVAIFNKMDEDQAAQILAQIDSSRAAGLTKVMLRGK
ncbi:MAG: hypothetical protein H6Q74_1039 [Firmicutes bacterium]|nr:hypothetical protein [Bacillota bacterium]